MQSFNARIEKKKKYLVLGQILQFRGCSDSKTVAALFPFSRTASVKGVARLVLQNHATRFSATWLISYVEIAPINRPVQFTRGQKESIRQARTDFMKHLGNNVNTWYHIFAIAFFQPSCITMSLDRETTTAIYPIYPMRCWFVWTMQLPFTATSRLYTCNNSNANSTCIYVWL